VTGQAVPSYSPQQAALYFGKMECFCFRQQTLAPGEVRKMPVVFVIDPKLPPELNTVTLSYTFFEVNGRAGAGDDGGGERANAEVRVATTGRQSGTLVVSRHKGARGA